MEDLNKDNKISRIGSEHDFNRHRIPSGGGFYGTYGGSFLGTDGIRSHGGSFYGY